MSRTVGDQPGLVGSAVVRGEVAVVDSAPWNNETTKPGPTRSLLAYDN
jgi:hypothetical protein